MKSSRQFPQLVIALLASAALASEIPGQETGTPPPETVSPRARLPLTLSLLEARSGTGGRIRITIETDPIFDTLLEKRRGRLRVAVFAGSGATRMLDSKADQVLPFDATIDRWILELPVHWSSQDTWLVVEVEETQTGARGEAVMELPPSKSFEARGRDRPTGRTEDLRLPMTLALSRVMRFPGGGTGRLSLTIQNPPISREIRQKAKGRLKIVVVEETGADHAAAISVKTTLPFDIASDRWSTTLPVHWSDPATGLSVQVEEPGTGIAGAGFIRVRPE